METSQILHRFSEIITQKELKRTEVKQPSEIQLLLQIMRTRQVSWSWGHSIPPCHGISSHPLQVPSPLITGGALWPAFTENQPCHMRPPNIWGVVLNKPFPKAQRSWKKKYRKREKPLSECSLNDSFPILSWYLPSSVQMLTTSVFCSQEGRSKTPRNFLLLLRTPGRHSQMLQPGSHTSI